VRTFKKLTHRRFGDQVEAGILAEGNPAEDTVGGILVEGHLGKIVEVAKHWRLRIECYSLDIQTSDLPGGNIHLGLVGDL
jgi:hypothetical protein